MAQPFRAFARTCAPVILATALLGGAPAVSAHDAPVGITHLDTVPAGLDRSGSQVSASAALGAGLPAEWCGRRTGRDQDVGSPDPSAAAVKLVYAHPADRPDRSARIARMLQRSAREIGLFVARESGGRKTIRFDLGTTCGARYLDLAVVKLAGSRASYLSEGRPQPELVRSEVLRSLGAASGPRNYLVYVDNLVDGASFGQAEAFFAGGDAPGAENPHNKGGLFAYVWSEDRVTLDLAETTHLVLHEVSHTLGAVQSGAPNTTGSGHCRDAIDVMCYSDGGAKGKVFSACRALDGVISEHFDCNQDDYFNPAPAPGSYLAGHWNVYDSAFLGSCGRMVRECGVGATEATVVKPAAKKRRRAKRR